MLQGVNLGFGDVAALTSALEKNIADGQVIGE